MSHQAILERIELPPRDLLLEQIYHLERIRSIVSDVLRVGTLFLGIENPKRSILFPAANRSPWIISTFSTFTMVLGSHATETCRSDASKEGRRFKLGGDMAR